MISIVVAITTVDVHHVLIMDLDQFLNNEFCLCVSGREKRMYRHIRATLNAMIHFYLDTVNASHNIKLNDKKFYQRYSRTRTRRQPSPVFASPPLFATTTSARPFENNGRQEREKWKMQKKSVVHHITYIHIYTHKVAAARLYSRIKSVDIWQCKYYFSFKFCNPIFPALVCITVSSTCVRFYLLR